MGVFETTFIGLIIGGLATPFFFSFFVMFLFFWGFYFIFKYRFFNTLPLGAFWELHSLKTTLWHTLVIFSIKENIKG